MLSGRLIICIGNSWDYDPTSKHQIMRILRRHNDVLWVNYHGTRRPDFGRADRKHALTLLARCLSGVTRVSDTMVQVTPLVIPGAKRWITRRLHERLMISQIRHALHQISPPPNQPIQLWTFAPDTPFLQGKFGEECFLYYCTDEYRKFDSLDANELAAMEDQLLDRADVVVACSEPLYRSRSMRRTDALLLRHGVDFDHFAAAWKSPPPCPPDLINIPRPIFGFFGLIHHWTDVKLLSELAARRPRYSLVLIGECKTDVTELRKRPNVHLLGRRPYHSLPSYCACFDAALLPFAQTEMTRCINPVKMYEYLAAGLPVVSTPLPEARRFTPAILIAETVDEFIAACDRILQQRPDPPSVSRLVQDQTWESCVKLLSAHIENALLRKSKCPTLSPASTSVHKIPICKPRLAIADAPHSHGGRLLE